MALAGLGQGLARDRQIERSWEFAWRWRESLAVSTPYRADAHRFGDRNIPLGGQYILTIVIASQNTISALESLEALWNPYGLRCGGPYHVETG